MVFPGTRALVSGTLFVIWLGFLAYLALANRGRIVVSVPQLERSNLIVLAKLTDDQGRPAANVGVERGLYAENAEWRQMAGQSLELKELAFFSANQGWLGPGEYVVPLTRSGDIGKPRDQVTLLPISPGYYPATSEVTVDVGDRSQGLAASIAALIDVPESRLR